jgi:hypothetical protein
MTPLTLDDARRRVASQGGRSAAGGPAAVGRATGAVAVKVKARALLLMCGLSLAGAAAADPLGAPRHSSDGWIFGPPAEGYNLPRGAAPDAAAVAQPRKRNAVIPLPRPRPDVPETTEAIAVEPPGPPPPSPPAAPMPAPTLFAGPAAQDAAPPEPASAPPTRGLIEPGKDNGAAIVPVSISDAGGGRIRIEAHEAGLDQVLAALRDAGRIQYSAADAPSRTITGTYTGTLPQVLSRMLDGQNYFLHVTASGTEFHAVNTSAGTDASGDTNAVLRGGISGSAAVASAPPPTPAPTFSVAPPDPAGRETEVIPSPAAARAQARAARRRQH